MDLVILLTTMTASGLLILGPYVVHFYRKRPSVTSAPHFQSCDVSVQQLRDALAGALPTDRVTFAGGLLHFNRVKRRDSDRFDIEFKDDIVEKDDGTLTVERFEGATVLENDR